MGETSREQNRDYGVVAEQHHSGVRCGRHLGDGIGTTTCLDRNYVRNQDKHEKCNIKSVKLGSQ